MIFLFLFLSLWFGYWSAESGASLPWSKSWQDKWPFGSEIPEIITAVSIASVGVWGFDKIFIELSFFTLFFVWIAFITVSYGGKQSATWAYLEWEGHKDNLGRDSTLRKWNDWLASKFNFKLGDEGYSWVWAATKGLITSLPVCGLAVIFLPIGREIASHAKGRLKGDSNTYMEFFGDGFGYSVACIVFVFFVKVVS